MREIPDPFSFALGTYVHLIIFFEMTKVFTGRTKATKAADTLDAHMMNVDEAVVYARTETGHQYTRELLYDAIAAGKLVAIRPVVGRGFRVRRDALDEFIAACEAGRIDRNELRAARSGKWPSSLVRKKANQT